jgi:hypothetical protein
MLDSNIYNIQDNTILLGKDGAAGGIFQSEEYILDRKKEVLEWFKLKQEYIELYESKLWLVKRYVTEKKTVIDMAKEAGCSHMTIQRALEKYGLIKNQRKWTK